MFELHLLFINVAIPSTIMIATVVALRLGLSVDNPQQAADPLTARPTQAELITQSAVALAAWLAIWIAFAMRTEFAIWHEDAWMRLATAVGLVGLVTAVSVWIVNSPIRWGTRLLGVCAAAYTIFPQGEAWQFLLPSRTTWIVVVSISSWIGWLLIDYRSPRQAAALGLGWIVLFAAAAFLTAQSFLKVTEPLLAVSSIVGCLSLATFVSPQTQWVAAATGPCLIGLSACVASAQFNSYLGLPDALSWFAMAAPTTVALVTYPLCNRQGGNGSLSRSYLIVLVLVCVVLAGLLVGLTVTFSGDEQW